MERKKTIQELISALKTLRIQEAELTAQLEEAVEERNQEGTSTPQHETERKREGTNTSYKTVSITREAKGVFFKGDRIWIKNKLHKPANWNDNLEWVEKEGKTATVTEVLTKGPNRQVHFLTDNGVRTWRAPNNVRLLTQSTQHDE